ncbi:MAG TPA: hypothetical protein VD995_10775 [Azospirillum sp.]|nr:hypothetical protein [Azospirillum sp.]
MDITSTTAGAAVALRQSMTQMDTGMKMLGSSAQQQGAVTALLAGGTGGAPAGTGGNVTETRGQNLNILV